MIGYIETAIEETTDVIDFTDLSFPVLTGPAEEYICTFSVEDYPEEVVEKSLAETASESSSESDPKFAAIAEKRLILYRDLYKRWSKRLGMSFLPPLVRRSPSDYTHDKLQEHSIGWTSGVEWALAIHKGSYSDDGDEKEKEEEDDDDDGEGSVEWDTRSLAQHLIRASTYREGKNIVEGRRVALLANGKRALVPACAEKGDLICAINLLPTDVVLRLDQGRQNMSVDSSLRSALDEFIKSKRAKSSGPSQSHASLVNHGTFIGDCFVDNLKEDTRKYSKADSEDDSEDDSENDSEDDTEDNQYLDQELPSPQLSVKKQIEIFALY